MAEILLFGGTTEGRELAALLRAKNIPTLVCVATEYGESLLEAGGPIAISTGRLDEAAILRLIRAEMPHCVIDATHPYAIEVGLNILAACDATGTRCLRILRESSAEPSNYMPFPDMQALTDWLNNSDGIVFSVLGAKEVSKLTMVKNYRERIWLRILPSTEGLCACLEAGFPASRIICMQGPFSRELNTAMFRATGASVLLTKESGAAGGFMEKLKAARDCGMTVAVLTRPCEENGMTFNEIRQRIEEGVI